MVSQQCSADDWLTRAETPRNPAPVMSRYEVRINKASFFTMVVRVDHDGEEQVDLGFRPRHFSSAAAAERAANRYLAAA